MHIADGILPAPVLVAGFAGTVVFAALTLRKMDLEEIPKVSVATSLFFVASLIHFPIGPTSVHLLLNGLVGIILGMRAFPAIMLGIVLQAILFGHGGVTVIGVNSIMLGGGGLVAYGVWQLRHYFHFKSKIAVFAFCAGASGTIVSGLVLSASLVSAGEAFTVTAGLVLLYHIPIMLIEGLVSATSATFLMRVKPNVLAGYRPEEKSVSVTSVSP